MSGGIAYVYDPDDVFAAKLNVEMVQLQQLDDDDREFVRSDRASPLRSHRVGRCCKVCSMIGNTRSITSRR